MRASARWTSSSSRWRVTRKACATRRSSPEAPPRRAARASARRAAVLRHRPAGMLQQQIHALVLDLAEAEAVIERERRVHAFDMDRYGLSGGGRLRDHVEQQCGAETSPARRRQERDVDDAKLTRPSGDVKAADGLVLMFDDEPFGAVVKMAIMGALGGELLR